MESNSQERSENNEEVHYTCRKCATHLFDSSAVLHKGSDGHAKHGIGVSDVKAPWQAKQQVVQTGAGGDCTSVFIEEPPEWANCHERNNGRLLCPRCKARVGSFSWSGAQCSCGRWVTPAFQFHLSRIDPKGLVIVMPSFPLSSHKAAASQ